MGMKLMLLNSPLWPVLVTLLGSQFVQTGLAPLLMVTQVPSYVESEK